MNTPLAFWRYDLFKLLVALILLMLVIMGLPSQPPAEIDPAENSNGIESPLVPSSSEEQATISPGEPTPGSPAFPEASVDLVLDDSGQYLLKPDGSQVYTLDQANQQWIPVISEALKGEAGAGYSQGETNSGIWIIQDEHGGVLYSWDPDTLSWIAFHSPPPTPDVDCPMASQPRLKIGSKARVKTNLNMRSSPGIQDNWLLTNVSGTELMVLNGPVCTAHEAGSYLWWEVENPSGLRGWSAEAQQQGYYYFLEPTSP